MQLRGGGRRGSFGQGREGFGGRRQGQGRGRSGPRNNQWIWKDDLMGSGDLRGEEDVVPEEHHPQDHADSKWGGRLEKKEQHDPWGPKAKDSLGTETAPTGAGNNQNCHNAESSHATYQTSKKACEICGMFAHDTSECPRQSCDICGFTNHTTYGCKKCLPWNYGPELCATQVEDQSFMFIDECVDPRVAREKASTTVISVINGSANAKQIELEFMNLIGADAWRWHARPIGEKKFLMRFSTAKMASQWSNLKNLTMRNEAQLKIET